MMAASWRFPLAITRSFSLLRSTGTCLSLDNPWNYAVTQIRCFPARKSTREKREKIKRAYKLRMASEVKTKEPSKRVKTAQRPTRTRTSMNHPYRDIEGECYIAIHNKRKLFPIVEAVAMHRETHHPTIFNQPNAPLFLSLELDMTLDKKNRFLDTFSGVVKLPNYFNDGIEKTVMAFCKVDTDQNKALDAGADIAGGTILIKKVLSGEVQAADYRFVVSHPDILGDVAHLRGILKKKFPSIAKGSIGMDMSAIVNKFKKGLEYNVVKDSLEHGFGWIDVPIGNLSMSNTQLEDNIGTLVKAVTSQKLKKKGNFITIAYITSPPSTEKISIDISPYMPQIKVDDDDDDDVEESSLKQ